MTVYEQHAQASGPWVSIIAGFPIFYFASRWIARSIPTALALFGVFLTIDVLLLLLMGGQSAIAILWLIGLSYATKLLACYLGGARLEAAGRGGAVNEDRQKLLPLLVHIQANLDGDLSLAALSRKAGLSPSHFHRSFKAAIGETPRDYVARLRVERGAFRLLLHDAKLVDVALDCGFQNHETFIRAFRRVFGKTPGEYREWIRRQVFERNHQARETSSAGWLRI